MLSRREFLRRSALASLALTLTGCGGGTSSTTTGGSSTPPVTPTGDPAPDRVDLAIVGGGMSGLYSAYRILKDSATRRVSVFEGSQRLGGRLFSIATEGIPHIPTEIGGMRVLSSQHLVSNLLSTLGMPLVPFPTSGPSNLYFCRGQRFTSQDVVEGRIPYQVAARERGLDPFGLIALAIDDTLPGADRLPREDWLHFKQTATYQGQFLANLSFQAYLRSRLSPEGFAFIMEGLGYVTDFGDNNAAEMFQNESQDGTGSPSRIVGGYQSLPLHLADEVRRRGGTISLGTTLRRIDRDSGGFVLSFTSGSTVRTREVILAMPPHSIKRLEADSLPLTVGSFSADLDSVSVQLATRLFLSFSDPWWTRSGPSFGFSRTDLPLRQCIYFGTEGDQAGADPSNRNSLILATYNDGAATDYWARFLDNPPEGGTSTPFTTLDVPADLQAPRALVEEAVRQLGQLHGVTPPAPYWAAYVDWQRDPYGAAWHFWRPGIRSWEVIPRVESPLPGMYVTGEAFSTNQGWVEGALDSAEDVLQTRLGLAPPSGISPAYIPANFDRHAQASRNIVRVPALV